MVQREQRKRKVASRVSEMDNAAVSDARERWLDTLENDNAQADEEAAMLNDDEDAEYEFMGSGDELGETIAAKAKKKKKKRLRTSTKDGDDGGATMNAKFGQYKNVELRRLDQWNMSLARMLQEEQGVARPKGMPSLADIEAKPSKLPPRRLCIVCGLAAPYTCSKCTSRFCSLRCSTVHEQTQCLKLMAAV